MTNQRLRGALLNAGMTAAALAEVVQVDPKSVSRWLTEGRIPHPATRQHVAVVLQQQETYLWPTLLMDTEGNGDSAGVGGIDRVWPMRCTISSETWHGLFNQATRQIDILVYAGAFLIEALDLADVLVWKAARGTRVRVLVADPASPAVRLRAAELSAAWLPQRCQSTLDYLRRVEGISLRPHRAIHYASLFRFDDLLLANTHADGIWACHSPVLQLHRSNAGDLFDFYTRTFDGTWDRWAGQAPARAAAANVRTNATRPTERSRP